MGLSFLLCGCIACILCVSECSCMHFVVDHARFNEERRV